jgi:hypothetical protein
MPSDIVPASVIRAIDSLTANEFAVELDGERLSGIFRVTGLIPFKLDARTSSAPKPVREPFKISKMVQRDPNNPFNRWLRETTAAKADIARPTRTLAIIAVDGGVEIRRWTIKDAWISEVTYSDFDTGSGELVQEIVTIQWAEAEETWIGG